jgi:hypothetical protein
VNFTYKIESYHPYSARLYVTYTPTDPAYDPLGGWVSVTPGMTAAQIDAEVIAQAPLHLWELVKSAVAPALVGTQGAGTVVAPPPYVPTAADIQADVVAATQARLDDFAATRNYDGILSACTYATSSVPKFAAEGAAAVAARDATWSALYTVLAEVIAGTRVMPTGFSEVEPLLPALVWPV